MAGQDDDPFADLGPKVTVKGQRTEPLSDRERRTIKSLFDTQPERKKAYLKRIGFQMNPDDENQIRPIGDKTPWHRAIEIDPSPLKSAMNPKELWNDITDLIGMDVGPAGSVAGLSGYAVGDVGQALIGAGAGAAGFAAGGPVGGAAAAGASHVGLELLKKELGDFYLDEDIPLDKTTVAIGATLNALGPELGSLVKKGGDKLLKAGLSMRRNSIVKAIKATGSVGDEVIEAAAKDIEAFSPEVVKTAEKELNEIHRSIIGTTDFEPKSTRELTKGILAPVAKSLNEAADKELNFLAQESTADWTVEELLHPLRRMRDHLGGQTRDETEMEPAYRWLQRRIKHLEKNLGPDNKKIDFKDGREELKKLQNDIFNKTKAGDYVLPGAKYLSKAIGGNENALRQIADAKATHAYEIMASQGKAIPTPDKMLPAINAQRSRVLDGYKKITSNLGNNTDVIKKAYLDGDSFAQEKVRAALSEAAELTGRDLPGEVEMLNFKKNIHDLYKKKPKSVAGEALLEGVKQAVIGGAAGASTGGGLTIATKNPLYTLGATAIGTGGGFVRGVSQGLSRDPTRGFRQLAGQQTIENAIDKVISSPVTEGAARVGGVLGVQPINRSMADKPEEDDPFGDL